MRAARRNQSRKKVGRGRGFPQRAAAAIARKYSLSHIVVFTSDDQGRSRITYYGKNDLAAMQCAHFSRNLGEALGWNVVGDWDCSSVRRLKDRIKELEIACARIVDGETDPVAIARAAGNFPDES